jgi:hypothetical protein
MWPRERKVSREFIYVMIMLLYLQRKVRSGSGWHFSCALSYLQLVGGKLILSTNEPMNHIGERGQCHFFFIVIHAWLTILEFRFYSCEDPTTHASNTYIRIQKSLVPSTVFEVHSNQLKLSVLATCLSWNQPVFFTESMEVLFWKPALDQRTSFSNLVAN